MKRIPIATIISYAFILAVGFMYGTVIIRYPLIFFLVWTPFCCLLGYRGIMIDYRRGALGERKKKIKFRLK